MRRKALIWQLFPVFFLITLASVLVVGLSALGALREFHYTQAMSDLQSTARLIRYQVTRDRLLTRAQNDLQATTVSLGRCGGVRVTLISPTGDVLADSDSEPSRMRNHADRPEVKEALLGRTGSTRHRSPTLGTMMVYVAIPLRQTGSDRIDAVLRVARPAVAMDAVPPVVYHEIALAILITAILAGSISLLVSRRVSLPLSNLQAAASKFAAGDFTSRAPLTQTSEFAVLAETLNSMASRLDEQVRVISQQSRDQQAILSSMREGVVAVGNDDRVLIVNPTAEEMLGVSADAARGRTAQEVFRNPNLLRFLQSSSASSAPTVEEIALQGYGGRFVQATGTALKDATGRRIGALVMLNDVTQTRRLENIRKEFVANVSHELRTPITSIKGFVETLLDGAIDDPEKSRDFLEIVVRQAERLNAIIEDLLALSALEQKSEAADIAVAPTAVREVLESAVASLGMRMEQADVRVSVTCPSGLTAPMNAALMEQAVTNLLDNAVKYSPSGSEVVVSAEEHEGEIAIHVADNGPGIEAEHLPRLFERFYRVDKARSRRLGGTGLGLAIVKHIVQVHNGRTDVRSKPGEGSTFSIYLPLAPGSSTAK